MPSRATLVKYRYGRSSATPEGWAATSRVYCTWLASLTMPHDQPHSNSRARLSSSSATCPDPTDSSWRSRPRMSSRDRDSWSQTTRSDSRDWLTIDSRCRPAGESASNTRTEKLRSRPVIAAVNRSDASARRCSICSRVPGLPMPSRTTFRNPMVARHRVTDIEYESTISISRWASVAAPSVLDEQGDERAGELQFVAEPA
jgi:hypothetical protein